MIRINVPARLDRLPWARRHWMIVVASPRLVFIHGRGPEAEELVASVERTVSEEDGGRLEPAENYIELVLGVKAERRSLEDLAVLLTTATEESAMT